LIHDEPTAICEGYVGLDPDETAGDSRKQAAARIRAILAAVPIESRPSGRGKRRAESASTVAEIKPPAERTAAPPAEPAEQEVPEWRREVSERLETYRQRREKQTRNAANGQSVLEFRVHSKKENGAADSLVEETAGSTEAPGIVLDSRLEQSMARVEAAAAAGSELQPPVVAMGRLFFGPGAAIPEEGRRISPTNVASLEFTASALATQPAFPPTVVEFNPGWHAPLDDARPEMSPPEIFRIGSHLLLGYGLRGISWFPLQDSLTPGGYGTPDANRFYRWDSGLSLNGSKQPAAREVQRIWGSRLAASHRRADFALVDALAALPPEKLAPADIVAVTNTLMQLGRVAQYAGLSSELVDPEYQNAEQLLRHALLLFPVHKSGEPAYALTARAQHVLDAYVRRGGVLACFPEPPEGAVFEQMQTGAPADSEQLPEGTKAWHVGAGRFVVLTKDFYSWVSLREEFGEGMKRFEAPFARTLLEALLKTAGVRASFRRDSSRPEASELVVSEMVSNEGTLALGDRSGGHGWLSVVNMNRETAVSETLQVLSPRASARLEKSTNRDWIDVPLNIPPQEALLLPLEVSLCLEPGGRADCEDGVVFSGGELVRAEREGKAMLLSFYTPAKAVVHLHLKDRPDHMEVDENPVNGQWTKASRELAVELLRGASPQFLHVLRVPLPYQPSLPERPKADGRHPAPAHFRFSPAGAVRLPLGEDAGVRTNPPLYVFRKGDEAALGVVAENLGGQGESVQVQATGQFNTSARTYVNGNELSSLSLKLSASTLAKAAAAAPAADGLYHGTLHFSGGTQSQDFPVAYAIVPEKGTAGYQFDFDADGSRESVLENSALRAIVSPSDGGRMVALVAKSTERNVASTMGLLEDVFSFSPNPEGIPRDRMRGRAGTYNRAYSAEWIPGADGPALRLHYDAPDVYPHGARIEKTARFTGDETIAVEYQVSLLPADTARLEEEAAGRIFATPLPRVPAPQSFAVLNSVPASSSGAGATQFCWENPPAKSNGAGAEQCVDFVPDGAVVSPPSGVRKIEIREARRGGVSVAWDDAGARLTLEPKKYSVLVKLEFPPLDPGGAVARQRIEFTVKEEQ
jgi:hypothetical protein